jgi:peptidyl-prolyl cis-trans isomerase C
MTLVRRLALVCAGMLVAAAPALAQQPAAPQVPPQVTAPPAAAPALPSVNGAALTEADVAAATAELGEALQSVPEATRREQLVDYLVTVRVLAAQARAENLAQGADYQARVQFLTDKYLMETFLRREIEKLVTPAAVEAFYRERVASQPPETEIRARHILVADEATAKAIIEELKAGKDFAELARERSTDPGSKDEGGDLGFFTRDRMVEDFARAAFALQPGQFSQEPVRSQFGWHVIRVEESRPLPVPTLQDMDGQIRQFLSRRAQAEVIGRLRAAARIERR